MVRSPRNVIAVLQFNFLPSEMAGDGQIEGSIGGISQATELKTVWTISQTLGNIAFGFPFSIILFEIQDTLKSTPAENRTMKKASIIAILVTTFFYICCGCIVYAAFGDNIPRNLFAGFGFYEPFWLLDFANACIVVFLVGGYHNLYNANVRKVIVMGLIGSNWLHPSLLMAVPEQEWGVCQRDKRHQLRYEIHGSRTKSRTCRCQLHFLRCFRSLNGNHEKLSKLRF
ncbi:hypothetical protein GIB67_015867 [Kingdonia uniflora]|uniref:Amino acid transporter transmembrane domain-containing protein n=1 Tax=Kingdonia uniflora TaxID=39325 RepID=A0A7J7NGF3_9MAGN|nr:hypothetical protein GIB67_015867 [Kingdonia uniflora]